MFLTDNIREIVRAEVFEDTSNEGRVFGLPRLVENLLNSQALCFNLFGEMKFAMARGDRKNGTELATQVFAHSNILPNYVASRISEVSRIEFEYSPGRRCKDYTDDGTAFDVFVEFSTPLNEYSFLGIEVKYHEHMRDQTKRSERRINHYTNKANEKNIFQQDAEGKYSAFMKSPIEQMWRDHLLANALALKGTQERQYANGYYMFLYPKDNGCCRDAIDKYTGLLKSKDTFIPVHLEKFVSALRDCTDAPWVQLFQERYLNFDRVDELLRMH